MPGQESSLWIAVLSAALLSGMAAGCGAPAAPLPPTLNLPQPVHDLAATRTGDRVQLDYTVPEKTTDKLPVRGEMTAALCRSIESGACVPVGMETIPAGAKTMSMTDTLPPALRQGEPRLLTYRVDVLNRAGKSAGDSAPAYAAAGAAPAPVSGLTATPQRKGIVLSWQGMAAPSGVVRFDRARISAPPPVRSSGRRKAPEVPAEQAFRLAEASSDQRVSGLDNTVTAAPGARYRYVAQRVASVTVGSHVLQLASQPGPPVEAEYRDIYPPPVPTGLVSAPDSAARAIDLNWTPDVDPGLGGYFVYRRPAGSASPPQKISPAGKPVQASSWSDTTALPGQRYAYSVSAIDTSGNESQRSAEVEDQWSADTIVRNPKP